MMADHKTLLYVAWLLYVVSEISAGSRRMPTDHRKQCPSLKSSTFARPRVSVDLGICKSGVVKFGYKCEDHQVTTKDGYILGVQRIQSGQSGQVKGPKIPVLLQHGILMDGFTWLLSSSDGSLALILAGKGYDVWIANSRGTKYSRGHTSLSHTDLQYWDWSWDELVAYDLPATVEHVYKNAGNQKLHFVGHSLGTLIGLTSFSQHTLIPMVRSAALLCPIAYVNHISSPLAQVASGLFLAEVVYWLGIREFDPAGPVADELLCRICKEPINCFDLLTLYTGKNCCLNSSGVDLFLEHEPQPTSTKALIHLSQMIRKGTIAKYDYLDPAQNMEHYGRPSPPTYDISAVPDGFPLFLSYGGQDLLSVPLDVMQLLDKLNSGTRSNLLVQNLPNYAHADYVIGVNAKDVVYAPMVDDFFKRYE